jgi:hypothetical protein
MVLPVKIFWNACSTFEASKADVSMNDKLFSAAKGIIVSHPSLWKAFHPAEFTCKCLCLFCRNSSQMSQIALVSYQHDDNVAICVVPQLLEPSTDVDVCRVLCNIVDQECSHRPSIVCRCDGSVSLLSGCILRLLSAVHSLSIICITHLYPRSVLLQSCRQRQYSSSQIQPRWCSWIPR